MRLTTSKKNSVAMASAVSPLSVVTEPTSGLSGPGREWLNNAYGAGWGVRHVANRGVELQPRADLLEVEGLAAGHRRFPGGCARRRSEGNLAWATLLPSVEEANPHSHYRPLGGPDAF